MFTLRPSPQHKSRLRPLAACLAIAFGADALAGTPDVLMLPQPMAPSRNAHYAAWVGSAIPPGLGTRDALPEQPQTVLLVQNCDDAGPDSLRDAVGIANTLIGDVTVQFDANSMQCSTITLTSGEIKITRDDLVLQGPGSDLLTIDGGYQLGYANRIFNHTGQGTLAINDLSLTDAKYVANGVQAARGGCVYGYTVSLAGTDISDCRAIGNTASAYGGGVFASASFHMLDGSISNCKALSNAGLAAGGGIHAGTLLSGTSLTVKYGVIDDNVAHTYTQAFPGRGGGMFGAGGQGIAVQRSTISGNHADLAGAMRARYDVTLSDSTISDNQASRYGAIYTQHAATLFNSTVAFNSATDYGRTAGISAQTVQSNSSILAFNITDDGMSVTETDVESADGMVSGANNLIMAAVSTTTPADTLSTCPRLAPLSANGGATPTLALLPYSPAIDTGNNAENLETDQRGTGFPRIVGGAPDIGAYEWAAGSSDFINRTGFEACE